MRECGVRPTGMWGTPNRVWNTIGAVRGRRRERAAIYFAPRSSCPGRKPRTHCGLWISSYSTSRHPTYPTHCHLQLAESAFALPWRSGLRGSIHLVLRRCACERRLRRCRCVEQRRWYQRVSSTDSAIAALAALVAAAWTALRQQGGRRHPSYRGADIHCVRARPVGCTQEHHCFPPLQRS